jgi:SAM-dependent methyltransferase
MSAIHKVPSRLCPACSAPEPIEAGERVWPLNWWCRNCGHLLPAQNGIAMLAPELANTISGFDPASFELLASVEATYFWFVARNELIVALANRFFPGAKSLLEIGCGNGAVLRALAGSRKWSRLVGSDLHPAGLLNARNRVPEAEFIQMDATRVAAQNAFDLIGAFDVLEHVLDDEGALRGLRRAIAPSGGVIIAVPQHPWLWSREDEIGHHVRRYRRGELEEKLKRNGFVVMFSSSFVSVLLPLMIASRLISRVRGAHADFGREMTIGPAANRALLSMLRAEVRSTLAGMRWPVGGSRVIVARAVPARP